MPEQGAAMLVVVLEVAAVVVAVVLLAGLADLVRARRHRRTAVAGLLGAEPGDAASLVVLRTTYNPLEADIIRGLLQHAGVPSVIGTDNGGGWRPEGLWRPARVMVRVGDRQAAERILAEAQADETAYGD